MICVPIFASSEANKKRVFEIMQHIWLWKKTRLCHKTPTFRMEFGLMSVRLKTTGAEDIVMSKETF